MNLSEADVAIAEWHDKQRLIAENLQSFAELPEYRRIFDDRGVPTQPLPSGAQVHVVAAMDGLQRLRQQETLLGQTMDQAEALRASLSRLTPSRETLHEIEQLLRAPVIELAAVPTTPHRRELLREVAEPVRVSLDQLLKMMLDSFRLVRDAVMAVNKSLDDIASQWIELDAKLVEATSLLAQLHQIHERAKQASAERELKVQMVPASPIETLAGDSELAELDAWIARLQHAVDKGEYGPAAIGLGKWREAASSVLATDRSTLVAAESTLRARRDLRGLFDALQAKARQGGRAENPRLSALGQDIRRLLTSRPTPMAQARELVARYQEQLM